MTLTSSSSLSGWAPVGNGEANAGPVRIPRTGAGIAQVSAAPQPLSTRVVPVGDLARPPRPPDLRNALRAAYPRDEQAQGRRGSALVRLRIAPNGQTGAVAVLQASNPAFGRACQEVLRGSRWDPPLSRDGSGVATVVRYRCQFELR